MGLFSKSDQQSAERSVRPRTTISGRPMSEPEEIGMLQRRARLMGAAVRTVAQTPAVAPAAFGTPLADGMGMEEVVETIRPLFAGERSLTRWVAIRGALTFLDMVTPDQATFDALMHAMGLQVATDPFTSEQRTELVPGGPPYPPALQSNAIGLFVSLASHLMDYERVAAMSVQQVNADPMWGVVNEAVALDYIAWAAVALWRVGGQDAALRMAEPGRLEQPGWYAEPLFSRAERYWDGTDWTGRVRALDGRRWVESSVPLR